MYDLTISILTTSLAYQRRYPRPIRSMASTTHLYPRLSAAPRFHLFTRATFSATRHAYSTQRSPFAGPSPPRLPKEDQEVFESLQRQSTGAFSTPRVAPQINQSPNATTSDRASAESKILTRTEQVSESSTSKFLEDYKKVIEARGKGEELHPNVRRGATPEFEGEKNPSTGEVGGPKNEPLRWGAAGEWSYNGRTTDF